MAAENQEQSVYDGIDPRTGEDVDAVKEDLAAVVAKPYLDAAKAMEKVASAAGKLDRSILDDVGDDLADETWEGDRNVGEYVDELAKLAQSMKEPRIAGGLKKVSSVLSKGLEQADKWQE